MRITRDDAKRLGLDYDALWRGGTPSPRAVAVPGGPCLVRADSGPGWFAFTIGHWRPAALNELMRGKHVAMRLKKRDRDVICAAVMEADVPSATGKRRVSLTITLPKGQRRWDKDAFHKTTLDALTHAGALVDDSPDWCEPGTVEYERGDELQTRILVEDVA